MSTPLIIHSKYSSEKLCTISFRDLQSIVLQCKTLTHGWMGQKEGRSAAFGGSEVF